MYFESSVGLSFVGNGQVMSVASLLANYPATVDRVGLYARVNDLWGGSNEVMRCTADGATFFWRPQRENYAVVNPSVGGSFTLTPLISAPVQYISGTLTSSMSFTPSAVNAWPGAQFTLVNQGALGLFGINISGLVSGILPLLAGGTRVLTFAGGAWRGA